MKELQQVFLNLSSLLLKDGNKLLNVSLTWTYEVLNWTCEASKEREDVSLILFNISFEGMGDQIALMCKFGLCS
jgi:hypothetical protein